MSIVGGEFLAKSHRFGRLGFALPVPDHGENLQLCCSSDLAVSAMPKVGLVMNEVCALLFHLPGNGTGVYSLSNSNEGRVTMTSRGEGDKRTDENTKGEPEPGDVKYIPMGQ